VLTASSPTVQSAKKLHAFISNSPTPPIASAHFAQTYPRSFQHAYTQPTAPLPSGLETNGSRSQDRSGVGVDPHQAGTAGSHGRATLRPGSGDRPRSFAAPRAWKRRAGKAQSLDAVSARRCQVGWPKAVQVINPDRVARLRSHSHAVYRLRDRSLAMPLTRVALLFDIAGRAGGGFRSAKNENPGN
jgi:hypothetical protein